MEGPAGLCKRLEWRGMCGSRGQGMCTRGGQGQGQGVGTRAWGAEAAHGGSSLAGAMLAGVLLRRSLLAPLYRPHHLTSWDATGPWLEDRQGATGRCQQATDEPQLTGLGGSKTAVVKESWGPRCISYMNAQHQPLLSNSGDIGQCYHDPLGATKSSSPALLCLVTHGLYRVLRLCLFCTSRPGPSARH